jgi:A/G-specific adenine glycosylase
VKSDVFQSLVWEKGRELYRDMLWRRDVRPYYVLVSELMLQQTQVSRVTPKFDEFVRAFPDVESLASAELGDVLQLWSGLGYNRRAKYLWQAAHMICDEFGGRFPSNVEELTKLPGVGPNTAGAIMAYAYNQPVVFIETNIRTVYLHHFFADSDDVADSEIRDKVAETIDHEHPREWYWALMDYGAELKAQKLGNIRSSKHYTKQSKLAGSLREMRGRILKALASGPLSEPQLRAAVQVDERYATAKSDLLAEQLISQSNGTISLG